MAKVQMFAVLSLDGCLSDNSGDARWILRPESYDIDKIFDAADYEFSSNYPTSRLMENEDDSVFIIEATLENADYINGLFRLRLIDEIIIYTIPFIAGTELKLFKAGLPISYWELDNEKRYKCGVHRSMYSRKVIE
ncbi:hypothetical protein [Bacteroides sp. 14(A)]|uniref:hypothetical protein n=1 Tax=Bacteroides sp. 14(A) TaxID=1163670 RepID=UPI000478611E|nr:hypothetical protein [Bacteroides sp. 14(A)]